MLSCCSHANVLLYASPPQIRSAHLNLSAQSSHLVLGASTTLPAPVAMPATEEKPLLSEKEVQVGALQNDLYGCGRALVVFSLTYYFGSWVWAWPEIIMQKICFERSSTTWWVRWKVIISDRDVRGDIHREVSSLSSSLISPDMFKQLESSESPKYPLQMGVWYGNMISNKRWLGDRPKCWRMHVNLGTTQKAKKYPKF